MTRLLSQILRRFTPPMLRSDSPNRPMVVRRRHWFLQETRFLFLTRKGPVEITVKPALILGAAFAGFVGTGVIAAATLFVGYKSVEKPVPWHDFHATVLHLLGIDHEKLSYYHNGIQRRLTNVHGELLKGILA